MEYLLVDDVDHHPKQHKNNQKLCDGKEPPSSLNESKWKLRQQYDQRRNKTSVKNNPKE